MPKFKMKPIFKAILITLTALSALKWGQITIDRLYMRCFLEDALIRNYALYTVEGAKPMTFVRAEEWNTKTSKSIQDRFWNKCPYFLKRHLLPAPQRLPSASGKELWDYWMMYKNHLVKDSIQFVRQGRGEQFHSDLYLVVNKPATFKILKKYRHIFVEVYGDDFNPEMCIEELGQDNHNFWTSVLSDHQTLGLLLGFGETNSKLFKEQQLGTYQPTYRKRSYDVGMPSQKEHMRTITKIFYSEDLQIEDLPFPQYVTYQENDPTIDYFKRQREHIIGKYDIQALPQYVLKD